MSVPSLTTSLISRGERKQRSGADSDDEAHLGRLRGSESDGVLSVDNAIEKRNVECCLERMMSAEDCS